LVTFLVPVLGHALCDEIGTEAHETGKSVREVVLEHGYLDEDTLNHLLSFDNIVVG
jgi:aspartate ammonia-lyase